MGRLLVSLALFAACTVAQAQMEELHLQEAGSAAVLTHSTFAHGYRHGYEEGYHAGNTDINMGRVPRTKLTESRDLKVGYSSKFGPKRLFEQGFHAGLRAGYGDGYLGHHFRAVESLRSVAASLETASSLASDPNHAHFDQGFVTGYGNGLERGGSDHSSSGRVDFNLVDCTPPANRQEPAVGGSYCEGYRRGFALGHADGFMLRPVSSRLEASK